MPSAQSKVTKITQLKKLDADRVDGVASPANGFPVLMLKAVSEDPDKAAKRPTDKEEELGVPNAPEVEKEAVQPEANEPEAPEAPAAEVEKTAEPEEAGEKDETADLVKSLAEKVEGQEGVIKGLQAELKRLSDTPIPGAPFVMAPAAANGKAEASKAAYYKDLADKVSDPELASYYRTRAAALAGN